MPSNERLFKINLRESFKCNICDDDIVEDLHHFLFECKTLRGIRQKISEEIETVIKSFSEAGYDIVYMDETWVNQNHCTDYMWLPNDGSDAPKIPNV